MLITGDKHLEMAARYEENALLEAVLKSIGNKKVTLYEMQGFDHGQVLGPACRLIADYGRDSNDILFWQEVRYMWYEFTTYMVFTLNRIRTIFVIY